MMNTSIAEQIITNATKLDSFKPEPRKNRFNIPTKVYCLDELPTDLIVLMLTKLYWINDRHGFFQSNKGNVVNMAKCIEDWDIGINEFVETSPLNIPTIGNRIAINVDGDITIYNVIGFNKSNGSSEVYFDVK